MDDQQRQKYIERYLDGQLSEEEQRAFEAQLQSDEELAKAYSLEETARLIIQTSGRAELRNRLDTFESAFEKKTTPAPSLKPKRGRWLAIAAVILVLTSVCFWLFRSTTAQADLFAAHFEVYPALSPTRGANTLQDNWQSAIDNYQKADYTKAAVFFQESLEDSLAIPYLSQFYLGVSLLAQDPPQAAAALAAFEAVLQTDHDYRQQASWYRSLALIKLERLDEAKVALKEMQVKGSFKRTEVEKILKILQQTKPAN